MERTCLRDCMINGLVFLRGQQYKVTYNTVDGNLYIYNVWGYTDISKQVLDRYFI